MIRLLNFEVGRTIRKPREPIPVQNPIRKAGGERFHYTLKKTVKVVNQFLPRSKILRPSQIVNEEFKLGKLVPVAEAPQITTEVHVGVQKLLQREKSCGPLPDGREGTETWKKLI